MTDGGQKRESSISPKVFGGETTADRLGRAVQIAIVMFISGDSLIKDPNIFIKKYDPILLQTTIDAYEQSALERMTPRQLDLLKLLKDTLAQQDNRFKRPIDNKT